MEKQRGDVARELEELSERLEEAGGATSDRDEQEARVRHPEDSAGSGGDHAAPRGYGSRAEEETLRQRSRAGGADRQPAAHQTEAGEREG